MEKFISFETERLLLKRTSVADASFVLEILNSPNWLKYIGDRNVRTLDDAKQYVIDKMNPQFERLGFSNYTVIRKSDMAKIGSCGLYDREGLEGVDIGFAFLPSYENKGYGYESASKIKQLAFSKFGLTKIKAITTKDNIASQKLIKKLGLTFKKFIQISNDSEELMLFEIQKEFYSKTKTY